MQPSVKNLKSYSKIPLIAGSFFWSLFFTINFFINLNAGICSSKQTENQSTIFIQTHTPKNSLASEDLSLEEEEQATINYDEDLLSQNTYNKSSSLCNDPLPSRLLTPYSFDLEDNVEEQSHEENNQSDNYEIIELTQPATFINSHKFTQKPSHSLLIHAYMNQPTPQEEQQKLQKTMRKKAAELRYKRELCVRSLEETITIERMNIAHSRRGYKTY